MSSSPTHEDVMLITGGIETTLMFKTSFPLRNMSAFETLLSPSGTQHLDSLQSAYADVALRYKRGLDRQRIYKLAQEHAQALANTITEASAGAVTCVVEGIVGPMSDAYENDHEISLQEVRTYHARQIRAMKDAGTNLISAATMTSSVQAEAVALEAADACLPCIVSFTLETDGRLPSGESLADAITRVDKRTNPTPVSYRVNCVHPSHIMPILRDGMENTEAWVKRLTGFRGNASAKSHKELDNSEDLDEGDPEGWAKEVMALRELSPYLTVLGGCCGTDEVHCEELAKLLGKKSSQELVNLHCPVDKLELGCFPSMCALPFKAQRFNGLYSF